MIHERLATDRAARTPLAPCGKCHKSAGIRKMTKTPPTLFFVVCANCGHSTKAYRSQYGASAAWNREGK